MSRRQGGRAQKWLVALGLVAACRNEAPGVAAQISPAAAEQAVAVDPPPVDDDAPPDLQDRAFPLLVWAAHEVGAEYYDPERLDPRAQLSTALTFVGLQTPEFFATTREDTVEVTVRARAKTFALGDIQTLPQAVDRLEEILIFAQSVLELPPEDLHELEYTAINGLFAPLDRHTLLLTPEEHSDLGIRTRGRFGGIGAQIRSEDRRIVVARVLPGTPAEKAGLLAGDVILQIDKRATVNMPSAEAQELLRGPVGEIVRVHVRRAKKNVELEIVRDTIHVDSVESELLPGGVAWFHILTFQENTSEQLTTAIKQRFGEQGATAAVLDLRGNTGGLLSQSTAIIDDIVHSGELVIVHSVAGREAEQAAPGAVLPDSAGLVVLLDEEAASASEVVGGGLQALGRAVVLGRGSFGKGTVQRVKPFAPYGEELALKVTVAEYRVAHEGRIQSRGVIPDVELLPVELTALPGIVRYYDDERFERQRERSLPTAVPAPRSKAPAEEDLEPPARVRYLFGEPLPEGTAPGSLAWADPEVRLASAVALSLVGAADVQERRDRASDKAEELARDEDGRIVAALGRTEVDWTDGAIGEVDLAVTARLTASEPVRAGEPFELTVEVENRGANAVARVHAITDCVHDELDGIELLIGRVEPGAKVSRTMRLHVMPWHPDFTDALDLQVHAGEPDRTPDARTQVLFEVNGADRPALAYEWWLVDDAALVPDAPARVQPKLLPGETAFTVAGNGDGILQPGERVLVAFIAHDLTSAGSPDVRAMIRNLSGAQGLLEEGAVTIGRLEGGQTRGGAFGLTVNDDADPERSLELELTVGDVRMRVHAQHELSLRVAAKSDPFVPGPQQIRVEGDPIRVYAGADTSMPIVAELGEGAVFDTAGRRGAFRVVTAGLQGRRAYVPADVGVEIEGRAGRAHALSAGALRLSVRPPQVRIDNAPRVTKDAVFRLEGRATHPERVRDVVVFVRPPGASAIDRKVGYTANAARSDAAARTLEFATEIPLEPGGNRITVLARDGDDVQTRHDLWVYRAT